MDILELIRSYSFNDFKNVVLDDYNIKNSNDETLFFLAMKYFKIKIAEVIFMKCRYISSLNNPNLDGDTPLHIILKRNCPKEVLEFLLDHNGAQSLSNVNKDGETPLIIAIKNNHFENVKVLCEFDRTYNALLTLVKKIYIIKQR